jgi:hypothetical protein
MVWLIVEFTFPSSFFSYSVHPHNRNSPSILFHKPFTTSMGYIGHDSTTIGQFG